MCQIYFTLVKLPILNFPLQTRSEKARKRLEVWAEGPCPAVKGWQTVHGAASQPDRLQHPLQPRMLASCSAHHRLQ